MTQLSVVVEPLAQSAGVNVCFNQSHIDIATGQELAEIDIEFENMLVEVKEGANYSPDHVVQLRDNYNHPQVNYPHGSKQVVYFAPNIDDIGRFRREALENATQISYRKNLVYDQRTLSGITLQDFASFLLGLM